MPMLIKQKTVNEYKELLKNPTIFLKEKEEFIKKYPQFNTKLKQDNFENQTNYFEYQIFNFLYTVFEDNHEFTKNFDILLQELEKCKNIDNISSIFCLFLFMQ
ncbi:hypothetical protein IKS57_03030 [bacterium]|nr:hypothetical protein [bacterium]